MACIVIGCRSHSTRKKNDSENINFHRLPVDWDLRDKWTLAVSALRPPGWTWTDTQRICSKHFEESCFLKKKGRIRRRLRPNAVPSLHLGEKGEGNEQPMEADEGPATNSDGSETVLVKLLERRIKKQSMETDEGPSTNSDGSETIHVKLLERRIKKQLMESDESLETNSDSSDTIHIELLERPFKKQPMEQDEGPAINSNVSQEKYIKRLEQRVYELERALDKAKTVCKRRFLRIEALRQKERRLRKVNSSLNATLTEYLVKEKMKETQKKKVRIYIRGEAYVSDDDDN